VTVTEPSLNDRDAVTETQPATQTSPATKVSGAQRISWMDTARGLAIVMVFLRHAVHIPLDHGLHSPWLITKLSAILNPFRMPLLVFLSGSLVKRALRKPASVYLYGKWQSIIYPYLVWTAVRNLAQPGKRSLFDLQTWLNSGYLWFLVFISTYFAIALLARRVTPAFMVGAFALLELALGGTTLESWASLGVYFFAGHAAQVYNGSIPTLKPKSALLTCVATDSLVSVLRANDILSEALTKHIPTAVFVMCKILVLMTLIELFDKHWRPERLRYIGRTSLVFYVTHFPVMVATTVVQHKLFPSYEAFYWLPNLAIALVVSALASWAQENYVLATMFYKAPELSRLVVHNRRTPESA
jgi:uncharacterized membrane protein YcfT